MPCGARGGGRAAARAPARSWGSRRWRRRGLQAGSRRPWPAVPAAGRELASGLHGSRRPLPAVPVAATRAPARSRGSRRWRQRGLQAGSRRRGASSPAACTACGGGGAACMRARGGVPAVLFLIQPGVSITSPEYRHCLLLDLVLDLFLSINKHMPRVLVNTFRTRARHAPCCGRSSRSPPSSPWCRWCSGREGSGARRAAARPPGHVLLLLTIDGGGCGSTMGRWREEEEDDDIWGPRVSDRREGLHCNIRIHIHLQLGSDCLHTYCVSFL